MKNFTIPNDDRINPFTVYNKFRVKQVIRKPADVGKGTDAEYDYFPHDPFVRIFITKETRECLRSLNGNASKLFNVIIYDLLKPKENYVYFKTANIVKLTGLSYPTIQKAIKALIDNSLITSYMDDTYWVNPHIFFKGSVVNFHRERGLMKVTNDVTKHKE